jgi:hypothetical protein
MTFNIADLHNAARAAVAQVLREDGSTLPLNETETRTHIVDPILAALGYRSLDQVRREYRLQASGQFVDYVLLAGDQRVVIEAKQVGAELGPRDASQLVGYCAQEGIRWAILTSGLQWKVFDIEVSGNWQMKHVADIDLGAAHRSQSLEEAIAPLTHFALDTLRLDDSALRAWAHEERARRHLDRLLQGVESPIVAAIADEMGRIGIHLAPDDVVALLRRGTTRPTGPVPPGPVPPTGEGVAYYVFPAGDYGGYTSLEHLRAWLSSGFWGVRQSSAHRTRVGAGDHCCFYATKVGVVAKAALRSPAVEQVTSTEWPGPNPFSEGVYKVPLSDICWLDTPIELDPPLRAQLNAFQGKDPARPWSWFIQSTNRLTEHDFGLLVGESPGT